MKEMTVFFYGSFMLSRVQTRYGLRPAKVRKAYLKDWGLGFTPMANVYPADGARVWGVLCTLPRERVSEAYQSLGQSGFLYSPHPVKVVAENGKPCGAVVYVSQKPRGVPPLRTYRDNILRAAIQRKFASEYIQTLKSFACN